MNLKLPDKSIIRKKRVLTGIVALAVVITLILMANLTGGTPNIATYRADTGEFIIDISEKGEIKAANSATVGVPPRVYGSTRIVRIVEDGKMVEEDEFLVQFDTSEFDKRVLDRTNELDNANADLESLNASIDSQTKEQENQFIIQGYSFEQAKLRHEQMKYEAAARQREMELEFKKAELNLKQAKEKLVAQKIIDDANIRKAELKVKQAEMNLKEADDQRNSLTLKAPKSGMAVIQTGYSPNGREKFKIGSTPWRGQEIVSIPDLSSMQVKSQVNEIDISRVKKGQQVVITLDALEGPAFYGTITNVAKLARTEMGSETKIFDVEITIDGEDDRLKPGMTAQCKIVTERVDGALYIPIEAVFDKEDTTVVYVKNGGYEERVVTVGKKNNDYIVIMDGVESGEEVALRDPTLPLEDLGIETGNDSKSGSNGSSMPL